ncbi:MAG: 50S ribosomal protein L24 [Microthrixaceae bacterium]|jgi:large subunit ribosomal protein L24|nr:50S ribosomal protein L24 [Actinomycetota bacterium]MBP6728327.1 50S ribosomal protein L24 [Microthrixaceae bacterium]HMS13593.1 50S ribosomal protein L24 [Microthrixaceae bacterium]HMT22996.1 50S ribosomal protein L24 [Microthrixaceae bacterium]HMT59948.1 50S ribosomal protein L24 [Microthrixaceae bacterium]
MKVRKGDRVMVIAGKDRGREGMVKTVLPRDGKVVVEGVNVAKRHRKPTRSMEQGSIMEIEMPIAVSNVAVLDADGKPTRVGYRVNTDGTKVRISKRTGVEL